MLFYHQVLLGSSQVSYFASFPCLSSSHRGDIEEEARKRPKERGVKKNF